MRITQWETTPKTISRRGQVRVLQLFLQAAHREGLLDGATFSIRDGELRWSGGGFTLGVKGTASTRGCRLALNSLAWLEDEERRERLDLGTTIRVVATMGGHYRPPSPWDELVKELEEAARVQAAAYLASERRNRPLTWPDFEAWTPEGHNLHPGAKTRQGFSPSEIRSYAPDFSLSLELPWLAIDKSLLSASGQVPEVFELDQGTWCVPVHPWQRQHILPGVYSDEWERGQIRDLDRPGLPARLSSSLRTVDPLDPSLPLLKLSVGSLMTSTERSMSRHTVRQGPLYSEALRRAMAERPAWAARVDLMPESGGLYWSDLQEVGPKSRQLSLLFRERPPEPKTGVAIPCSALPQPCPWNGGSSLLSGLFSRGPGALVNLRRYCELLLPAHLGLLQDWGLALEGHLQNCLMVWSEEGPERLWLRDWGGLRVDPEIFARRAPDLVALLAPDSVTFSTAAAARRKLVACLYSNHLTEMVVGLSRSGLVSEHDGWSLVREVSRQALDNQDGRSDPEGYAELSRAILQHPWPFKALLRMRLEDEGELYLTEPNPLAAPAVVRPSPAAVPGTATPRKLPREARQR